MLVIPVGRIAPDTLVELIRDWLTRQSQDWDFSHGDPEASIASVQDSLQRGVLLICWDAELESLNLINKDEYQRVMQHTESQQE